MDKEDSITSKHDDMGVKSPFRKPCERLVIS